MGVNRKITVEIERDREIQRRRSAGKERSKHYFHKFK